MRYPASEKLENAPASAYCSRQRRHLSGRAARGSVSLRKMACRSAAES